MHMFIKRLVHEKMLICVVASGIIFINLCTNETKPTLNQGCHRLEDAGRRDESQRTVGDGDLILGNARGTASIHILKNPQNFQI